MRETPPENLLELLGRLGLGDRAKIRRAARYARRLARDLPLFESVWVDALAHAGLLTPFQAQKINAGCGDELVVGPFVLERPSPSLGYADCFVARDRRDKTQVQLAIASRCQTDADQLSSLLRQLAVRHQSANAPGVLPIQHVGVEEQCFWAACALPEGETVAQWMTRNGRFPVTMVQRIALRMSEALESLHQSGIVHGDLRVPALLIDARGDVYLPFAGLRTIVRPGEGFACTDLQCEVYDGIAPEQIREAMPASVATDIYACGTVWWHMLAGRAGVAGGNALAKLQATVACEIDDVRHWAFDASEQLAELVSDCVQQDRDRRPSSADELTARLHAVPTSTSLTRREAIPPATASVGLAGQSTRRRLAFWSGLAACIVLTTAATWPVWRGFADAPTASIRAKLPAAKESKPTEPPAEPNNIAPNAPHPVSAVALPENRTAAEQLPVRSGPKPLVLSGETPHQFARLDLEPGQVVCGIAGRRPIIVVPTGGLVVDTEDIVFRNVDFLWHGGLKNESPSRPETIAAIIHLKADRAGFFGCTFTADGIRNTAFDNQGERRPIAIRWTGALPAAEGEPAFVTGQLRTDDSVFRNVAIGIDGNSRGAVGIEMYNTLHLGPGPLIRLRRWPSQEDPTAITLSHVTLRDAKALVEVKAEAKRDSIGRLAIVATNCVLQPSDGGSLLLFAAANQLDKILSSIHWTGEGALLCGPAGVAAWQQEGPLNVIDDTTMKIAGLIRDHVGFAGPADGPRSASRIIHSQAPVRGDELPGILNHSAETARRRDTDKTQRSQE